MSIDPAALTVRRARLSDVSAMVKLIEAERREHEKVEPLFWRKATGSAAISAAWFAAQMASRKAVVLVAAEGGRTCGFLIANQTPAPPVYSPGETWTVDDFVVGDTARWPDIGRVLWDAIIAHGRLADWRQVVCVCAVADSAKASLLEVSGMHRVSEWWTGEIEPGA